MYKKDKGIVLMFLGILIMLFFVYIALFGLYVDNYTGYYLTCRGVIFIGFLIFGYGLVLNFGFEKNFK